MSERPETDGEFLARLGTNSELWAAEFVKRFPGLDGEPGSLVHAWFANAIGAGQSDCYRAVLGQQAVVDAARACVNEWDEFGHRHEPGDANIENWTPQERALAKAVDALDGQDG